MRTTIALLAVSLSVAAFAPRPAAASFIATLRARPLRVLTLPPNDSGQPQVRIGGVFSLFDESTMTQLPARCGSIDFFCRGNVALCNREWADLAAAAVAGSCVAVSLRFWANLDTAVEAPDALTHVPNPYDPAMGVATVPCRPEPPGPGRPDLTVQCSLGGGWDGGMPAAPPKDAAPSPPPPPVDAAATPGAEPPSTPPPAPGAEPPITPPKVAKRSGCSMAGSPEVPGTLALLLAVAVPAIWVRRRRRG
jgi:hypothetical protein